MLHGLVKRRVGVLMVATALLLGLGACGTSQPAPVDENEPSEESAAAVLEAYRNFGGDILELSSANPTLTAEVDDLQGTVPAYDLTGGDPPCTGFVRPIPSLVFTLAEGGGQVKAEFVGNGLSSLIVVAEGEEIVCDPDAPPALKPQLTLENPTPGQYGVWVGRADTQLPIDGTITVALTQ